MDLLYQICDFTVPSSAGKYVNKESMIKVLNSDKFKRDIENKNTVGTMSHQPREDIAKDALHRHLPPSDLLLKSGEAVNYTKEVYIDGDKMFAKLHLLANQKGDELKRLIKEDDFVPLVSMSVQADIVGDQYMVTAFNGVDFTQAPALAAKCVSIDFSAGSEAQANEGNSYLNFMGNNSKSGNLTFSSSLLDIIDTKEEVNFSKETDLEFLDRNDDLSDLTEDFSKSSVNFCEIGQSDEVLSAVEQVNFSLNEYVRMRKRKPMQVMQLMVNEVVRYINSKPLSQLEEEKDLVLEYFRSYVIKFISDKINDPRVKMINLSITLGLNRYCDRRVMQEFQLIANKVSRELSTLHAINKVTQNKFVIASNKLIYSLIQGIMSKVNDKKKAEIFLKLDSKSVSKTGLNSEVTDEESATKK